MSENSHHPQETLSRRELLKKLGAAGAILGARAIVPVNWAKPASETGLLPVHAQVSGVGTVNGEIWEGPFLDRPSTKSKKPSSFFSVGIQSTILTANASFVGSFEDPNHLGNFYDRYTFSVANVPQGLRTVIAHGNTPCVPDDQTKNITVGPGSNALPTPFIFAPCQG